MSDRDMIDDEWLAAAWTDAQETLQADGNDGLCITDAERVLAEHVIRLVHVLTPDRSLPPTPSPEAAPPEHRETTVIEGVCAYCAAIFDEITSDLDVEGRGGDMGEGHYAGCPNSHPPTPSPDA